MVLEMKVFPVDRVRTTVSIRWAFLECDSVTHETCPENVSIGINNDDMHQELTSLLWTLMVYLMTHSL